MIFKPAKEIEDTSRTTALQPSSVYLWTCPIRLRHNERDGVSNCQPHNCLLKRLSRRRSKKTPKLRVTGPCAGNSPMTSEFPAQRASNAENVSIWWRHHAMIGFERKDDVWDSRAYVGYGWVTTPWMIMCDVIIYPCGRYILLYKNVRNSGCYTPQNDIILE